MITQENTLAEIVRKFPAAAALFEEHDLDYCCHGKVTLKEACPDETKFRKVAHTLHRIIEDDWTNPDTVHVEKLSVGDLIHHIVSRHHAYVKHSMPLIYAHLEKVAAKHGSGHPELREVFQLFGRVKTEMEHHMFKEENILFPRMKEIQDAYLEKMHPWVSDPRYLEAPIGVMEHEHEQAGNILHEIRRLTSNYHAPDSACTTYRLCFDELKQFEHDLHKHVHLENNILFPRTRTMEQELVQGR